MIGVVWADATQDVAQNAIVRFRSMNARAAVIVITERMKTLRKFAPIVGSAMVFLGIIPAVSHAIR